MNYFPMSSICITMTVCQGLLGIDGAKLSSLEKLLIWGYRMLVTLYSIGVSLMDAFAPCLVYGMIPTVFD